MSRFFLLVAVAALLVPLLTRGSYRRLLTRQWRWGSMLFIGLALQGFIELFDTPASGTHQVGYGMLVASYVLVGSFAMRNVLQKGMAVVAIGVAANFAAIVINEGMAVDVPVDWQTSGGISSSIKHHPQTSADDAIFLTDIIVIRDIEEVISFGDLIMAAGLINAAFHASRKHRRSKRRADSRPTDAADPTHDAPIDLPQLDQEPPNRVEEITVDTGDQDLAARPPSPTVAGVIEELAVLRRSAKSRHPSALAFRASPLVGRCATDEYWSSYGNAVSASTNNDLEGFEDATVIHISGAGIQGLKRQSRA